MTGTRQELSMAPAGCGLDARSLTVQLDRYRQLGTTATSMTQRDLELEVSFRADVDLDLLGETIATEQQCCSFFTLNYDASDRRLSISVDGPDRLDALKVLLSALRDPGTTSSAR
jgi:hypothetical protein